MSEEFKVEVTGSRGRWDITIDAGSGVLVYLRDEFGRCIFFPRVADARKRAAEVNVRDVIVAIRFQQESMLKDIESMSSDIEELAIDAAQYSERIYELATKGDR